MKQISKILFLALLLTAVYACNSSKDNPSIKKTEKSKEAKYTIKGFTTTKSDSIYLLGKDSFPLQKLKIQDNKINFTGTSKNPTIAYLKFNDADNLHSFVLENSTFNVLFSETDYMIIGGNLNTKLTDYQKIREKNDIQKARLRHLLAAKKMHINSYLLKIDKLDAFDNKRYLEFLKENQNNLLTYHLVQQENYAAAEVHELRKHLKNSTNEELKSHLKNLYRSKLNAEALAKIENRPVAKNFSGTNLNRRATTLAEVTKDKKAVLIDFWASWCAPCRALSPKVKSLYFKYFDKGFDIITVSQDRSVEAWEIGVVQDGMENWNHVYDDDNSIAKMYEVGALPHMILLDEKGRIIKSKISYAELKRELRNIFRH